MPPFSHEDGVVIDVIEYILSEGRTSRLHRRLVEEKKIAVAASAEYPASNYPTIFTLHAIPRPPHTTTELDTALREELAILAQGGVEEWELRKARTGLEAGFVRGLESAAGLSVLIGTFESICGWEYLNRYIPRVRAVTPQEIVRVAKKYFGDENCTTATIREKGEAHTINE
ncbi:MAG: insulinase family protein [Candidatus Aureabacteria bacterium]|nr:insulinase family protein [Candidatus Auribacterota bacterium]